MMFLKVQYRLGYESLCREVGDSLTWLRFCRIGLGTSVPHPSRLGKLTTRCGAGVITERGVAREGQRREGRQDRSGPGGHDRGHGECDLSDGLGPAGPRHHLDRRSGRQDSGSATSSAGSAGTTPCSTASTAPKPGAGSATSPHKRHQNLQSDRDRRGRPTRTHQRHRVCDHPGPTRHRTARVRTALGRTRSLTPPFRSSRPNRRAPEPPTAGGEPGNRRKGRGERKETPRHDHERKIDETPALSVCGGIHLTPPAGAHPATRRRSSGPAGRGSRSGRAGGGFRPRPGRR